MTRSNSLDVPAELVHAIQHGRCVAFVGAGFVQPDLPSWPELLAGMAGGIGGQQGVEITEWLKQQKSLTNRDYEGIAECIKQALGARFDVTLEQKLRVRASVSPETQERLNFLAEVPFQAVLTTNFDNLIDGELPEPSVYADILTAPPKAWWSGYYWRNGGRKPTCVKLHGKVGEGDVESLVFTTREYRNRLHADKPYRAFLRALFATRTVLYLGFSFADAYINDLRSEVLAMLGLDSRRKEGRDFAIMNDVPAIAARHFADNEGLEILGYSTGSNGGRKPDFSGFNNWLAAIRAKASPEATLQEMLRGKKILWVDPSPHNNEYAYKVMGKSESLTQVETIDEALAVLTPVNAGGRREEAMGRYDIVLTCFGWQRGGPSTCEQLLLAMRKHDLRAPVIVFSSGAFRTENRHAALELGALAYTDSWEELFEVMEGLLVDGQNRNCS